MGTPPPMAMAYHVMWRQIIRVGDSVEWDAAMPVPSHAAQSA
jgi:hypothetical protein